MAKQLAALTEQDVRAIREVVRFIRGKRSAIERGLLSSRTLTPTTQNTAEVRLIKAPEGGIPARDGYTLGHAVCNVVKFWIYGPTQAQVELTSETIDVFNWGSVAIMDTGERLGVAYRVKQQLDYFNADYDVPLWIAIAEDCSDDTTTPVITGGGGGTGTTGNGNPTNPQLLISQPPDQTPTVHDSSYSLQLQSQGTDPRRHKVYSGTLPTGLTIDEPTGLVSGEVTAVTSRSVRFMVTDGNGYSAITPAVSFDPVVLPVVVSGPSSTSMTVGVAYSDQITATYGLQPYTYTVDTLPDGISLDAATGELSGTPTTSGSVSSTFTVYDSYGQSETNPVTFAMFV